MRQRKELKITFGDLMRVKPNVNQKTAKEKKSE